MQTHPFHPPTSTPDEVQSYVQNMEDHASDYGAVPMNSQSDLAPLAASAGGLKPLAKQIADLEIQLATLQQQYNAQALPVWKQWVEHMKYARDYAETHGKPVLTNYLKGFNHHVARHAASVQASPPAGPAKV